MVRNGFRPSTVGVPIVNQEVSGSHTDHPQTSKHARVRQEAVREFIRLKYVEKKWFLGSYSEK